MTDTKDRPLIVCFRLARKKQDEQPPETTYNAFKIFLNAGHILNVMPSGLYSVIAAQETLEDPNQLIITYFNSVPIAKSHVEYIVDTLSENFPLLEITQIPESETEYVCAWLQKTPRQLLASVEGSFVTKIVDTGEKPEEFSGGQQKQETASYDSFEDQLCACVESVESNIQKSRELLYLQLRSQQ